MVFINITIAKNTLKQQLLQLQYVLVGIVVVQQLCLFFSVLRTI